jgi:hypothetical protein
VRDDGFDRLRDDCIFDWLRRPDLGVEDFRLGGLNP